MIKEWEELNAKATPGPWEIDSYSDGQKLWASVWASEGGEKYKIVDEQYITENAKLVVFLRNNSEALLSLVKAAKDMRDCKGRYHTEQSTNRVFEALAKLEGK